MVALLLALVLAAPSHHPATAVRSNSEMNRIFTADQAARADGVKIDWSKLGPQDRERRKRTAELLAAGALKSGSDFVHAAYIFQHGDAPNDYLMAHTLAVVAAAKGDKEAPWIAAATLDRYLNSIGKPQIYGTQFNKAGIDKPWTQEPFDRSLISDALRQELGAHSLAEQAKKLEALKAADTADTGK